MRDTPEKSAASLGCTSAPRFAGARRAEVGFGKRGWSDVAGRPVKVEQAAVARKSQSPPRLRASLGPLVLMQRARLKQMHIKCAITAIRAHVMDVVR